MNRLRQVDKQVYDRIVKQDIKPQFFAFRSGLSYYSVVCLSNAITST